MADEIKIALVGIGAIARSQHLPVLAASDDFELVAAVSRHSRIDGVAAFPDLDTLLTSDCAVDAVSFCTPPQGRATLARAALAAGKHVMLEKPPGTTVAEVAALARQAETAGLSLFASWHSRAAAAVEPARAWLAGRRIRSVRICWKEDVRIWHPGQEWIWHADGMGVFDPGINALSIATHILPGALGVESAAFLVPANREAPIAASLRLALDGAPIVEAEFDFRRTGAESWDIEVATEAGKLLLSRGGARLTVGSDEVATRANQEYADLYARFAALIRAGSGDVDLAPLQLVADAFRLADRRSAEAFHY